jgi:predicted secreted protein
MNDELSNRRREIDRENVDEFVGGADVHSNSGKRKKSSSKKKVEGYSTKLYPETIKAIKAFAYVERKRGDRQVIEKAIELLYSSEEEKKKYIEMWESSDD